MSIGIIGAGAAGGAFARRLAAAKVPGIISNRQGPGSLAALVADIGGSVRAGTREEAALQDVVFVAVNWSKPPTALSGLPNFGGRVVIDANNPIEPPTFQPADLGNRQSTEVFIGQGHKWTSISTIAILSISTCSYEQVTKHDKCNRSPLDQENARSQMELAARRGTNDIRGGSDRPGQHR